MAQEPKKETDASNTESLLLLSSYLALAYFHLKQIRWLLKSDGNARSPSVTTRFARGAFTPSASCADSARLSIRLHNAVARPTKTSAMGLIARSNRAAESAKSRRIAAVLQARDVARSRDPAALPLSGLECPVSFLVRTRLAAVQDMF
jgi:hypothetical protein